MLGAPDAVSSRLGSEPVDLPTERAALERAREAAEAKLERLRTTPRTQAGIVFAEHSDPWINEGIESVLRGTIETLRKELVVFGRVDDDQPWRIGRYGVDRGGDQLVVDWRARFAERFYRATFELGSTVVELRTAYRMSAEIAAWLNDHATATGLPAVPLVGIRPTGRPVVIGADPNEAASALRPAGRTSRCCAPGRCGATRAAASRAAHELAVC